MLPKSNLMTGLLQQAKQVQEKIEALQGELAALRIEGHAGGGMVTAVVNGQQELLSVKIDPSVVKDSEDMEMIEDLVVAAVRQAMEKSKDESQQKVNALTGGMLSGPNLPEI